MSRLLCYVCLFILLLFTSCHGPNKDNKNLTVFRYNESAGITSLDPAFAKDQANIWACNQLYNGLVQLDDKLNVIPCIAKSWEISNDGLDYTFHLRNDVFFYKTQDTRLKTQDFKRKVIASDFVYSLNRLIDPKVASPGGWVLSNVKRVQSSMSKVQSSNLSIFAVNDSTLRIELKEAFPPFLGLLSMQYCSVVPKEAVEYYGKDFRKNPVGTGPFQFSMWKEGVKLVLSKNKNYFEKDGENKLPYLDAIAITFIIDKQTAFLEFAKGNIDFLSGIDPGYKDELLTQYGALNPKYRNRFNLIRQPYLNTEYLGFQVSGSRFQVADFKVPKLVRQAINYGIDRKKMMRYLRNNIGTAAYNGMIPKGLPSYDSVHMIGYDYQPERAKALLKQAGYPDGTGLPDIVLSTTSSYIDLCKSIQEQLAEIGIKLKIDLTPPATLRELIAQSKLPFFRGSWIADYPDAENYLSLFYSKNFSPQGPNYTHFSNKAFDALYEKAKKVTRDSIRFEYYKEMDKLIMEESPVVVLYYDEVLRFTQKNIHGLGSNPLNLLTLKRVRKR